MLEFPSLSLGINGINYDAKQGKIIDYCRILSTGEASELRSSQLYPYFLRIVRFFWLSLKNV